AKLGGMSTTKPATNTTQEKNDGSSRHTVLLFSSFQMVKVVMEEMTGKERYKCLKCGSLLGSKCYIKEHMKNTYW
ncbi:hypothetical protein L9F63_014367, partial [Diploptera punctata]